MCNIYIAVKKINVSLANLQADSNRCIFGEASNRDSDGQPSRARLTRGAPGPVASSRSSGTVVVGNGRSGIIGTAQPSTIGPLVAPSSCINPV